MLISTPKNVKCGFGLSLNQSCTGGLATDHTSHCKTNKYLIKVPLIIDGGHLAAILSSVWPSGVED